MESHDSPRTKTNPSGTADGAFQIIFSRSITTVWRIPYDDLRPFRNPAHAFDLVPFDVYRPEAFAAGKRVLRHVIDLRRYVDAFQTAATLEGLLPYRHDRAGKPYRLDIRTIDEGGVVDIADPLRYDDADQGFASSDDGVVQLVEPRGKDELLQLDAIGEGFRTEVV